jgi:hypothetical protein
MTLPPLVDVTATRTALHRLAEERMAAAQKNAIGTIRLAVTDDGFSTRWYPADSGGQVRLRVAGMQLLHEQQDGPTRVEPLDEVVDAAAAAVLYAWWSLGWAVLQALAVVPGEELSEVVLWPEHFDAGATLTLADGRHLNLGFSPGDEFCAEPYVYAGPWESFAGEFWNAPFGAFRRYSEIAAGDDPAAAAMGLLAEAREVLGGTG